MVCKRCQRSRFVKNGKVRGHQRYRCKDCQYNFTDTPPRGCSLAQKVTAILLHISGLSMTRTAKLVGVSVPTIQDWIEEVAAAFPAQPKPVGRAIVIELDERWHYLKKSPTNF